MLLGEKERCLAELKRLPALANQVCLTAKRGGDFRVSVRNPLYFADAGEDSLEEWMPDAMPELLLPAYGAFFGDDDAYRQFRQLHSERTDSA